MRRLLLIPFAAVALVAAAALSGVGRPEAARGEDAPQRDTVTTLGRGTVTTVPVRATISAGVRSDAPTAAEALAQNSEHMERVVAALRHAGGTKLQTQQVSLYPRTGDNGATVGFVAQNSVSAQAKIAGTGTLVDAAVAAGANTVEGPMLERSDREPLYRDALERAGSMSGLWPPSSRRALRRFRSTSARPGRRTPPPRRPSSRGRKRSRRA